MSIFTITWSDQVDKLLPPILRDADITANGDDFATTEADSLYILCIVLSSPGHWKEFPRGGISIWSWLQSTKSPQSMKSDILFQLTSDIFKKPIVDVSRFPVISINGQNFEVQ